MGVVFSSIIDSDSQQRKEAGNGLFEKTVVNRDKLRLEGVVVQRLVETYANHYYLPVTGKSELWSLMSTALGLSFPGINILFSTIWEIFNREGLCRTQEVLVCLALISDAAWRTRLSHIFDIFKSTCTNEIFSEDIVLGLEVALQACLSLWGAVLKVETDRDEVHTVSEEIAAAACDKLGKNADDGICREDFLLWAAERFKESRTVAGEDALLRVYMFP